MFLCFAELKGHENKQLCKFEAAISTFCQNGDLGLLLLLLPTLFHIDVYLNNALNMRLTMHSSMNNVHRWPRVHLRRL